MSKMSVQWDLMLSWVNALAISKVQVLIEIGSGIHRGLRITANCVW